MGQRHVLRLRHFRVKLRSPQEAMMLGDWRWSLPQHYWESPKLLDLEIFDDNPLLKTSFSSRFVVTANSEATLAEELQCLWRAEAKWRQELQEVPRAIAMWNQFSNIQIFFCLQLYNLVPCMGLVFGGIDFEWWNWTKVSWRRLKSQTQPEADIRNAEIECKACKV